MRRFVIGTAGHVDHGKTTLVRALTGVDTDRLPEEKKRGITIELGFARWDLGDGLEVSLIDVPGHRRFVHTMIAGASGIELVLLVVAADEGVMPQTREHVAACQLLGIRRAVVAVTKLDRVGLELATLAGEEALSLLGDRFDAEVVPCSARTGEGISEVAAAVRRTLARLPPAAPSVRARLAVDRVFSVRGAGTVVTGTLVEGSIDIGAPLFLVGEDGTQPTSARGLHVHDRAVPRAEAPTRLAVNLAGLSLESVHRGSILTDDACVRTTRAVDVTFRSDTSIKRGATVSFHAGTSHVAATVAPLDDEEARPIDYEGPRLVRLRLNKPMVLVGGDRFVLRGSDVEGPAGAVLGGGEVLDAAPSRQRPRAKRRAVVAALAHGEASAVVRALVEETSPRPFLAEAFVSRFSVQATALKKAADTLTQKGELTSVARAGWIRAVVLRDLAATARRLVEAHQRAAPLDRGMALETLRQKLAVRCGAEVAEQAIRLAASNSQGLKGEPIVVEGDVVRPASGGSSPEGAVAASLRAAANAVRKAGLRGVTEFVIREAAQASSNDAKALLARLVRDGFALHAGELWFSRASFDELKGRVVAHLAKKPLLTIAEFKELSGLGRKQAIVLLEELDREGVTRREGDDRFPGRVVEQSLST